MTSTSDDARPLALVTGGAGGLGQATAKGLLTKGCDVILCDVNEAAGQVARAALSQQFVNAQIAFEHLDLSDLAAIQRYCEVFQAGHRQLDILVNNAGLFPTFARKSSAQGCELGFAVGFYGHFALTALLLPVLLAAPVARVVTVSSIAHSAGCIDTDDPLLGHNYDANRAYSACKMACLILARELDRRARQHGASIMSVAAHPGIARTRLGQYADNVPHGLRQRGIAWATRFAMNVLGQDAEQGALPLVHAATAADVSGGQFIGPMGFGQFKGMPGVVKPSARNLQRHDAEAIWCMAEHYTGLRFDWTGGAL